MKTKERILIAGLKAWPDITLQHIASITGLSKPAVFYHFPYETLKPAVIEYAVEKKCSRIIVQLIALKHPIIDKLSAADRIRYFNAI